MEVGGGREAMHLDSNWIPIVDTSEDAAHVSLGDELSQLHPGQCASHLHSHPPWLKAKPNTNTRPKPDTGQDAGPGTASKKC